MENEKRLIDANELKGKLYNDFSLGFYHEAMDGSEVAYTRNELFGCIDNAPTVDAVEVVHGEWVVCGDGENVPWMCSHCGKTTAHKYKTMYGKYCPNCGAKMDGGNDDV